MGDSSLLLYITLFLTSILVLLPLVWWFRSPDLSHIPAVGSPGFLGSCRSAIQFLLDGQTCLQEGYDRYKPRPFRVLTLNGWLVILNRQHLDDIASISESDLSFFEAGNSTLKVEYTFGSEVQYNPYHSSIVRTQLSRNLPSLCPDIKDEMVNAFEGLLDLKENEWKAVPAFETIRRIVSRTSNRVFVGLPLCRDPGWNDFTVGLAAAVAKEAFILRILPAFIVPWIARYVADLDARTRKGAAYLGPIVQERQRNMDDKYASKEWSDRPNDFLQWCLDAGQESSVVLLTQRIMMMNFAAIHTTANTFTQALYHLAVNPQFAKSLREEVEAVVEEDGWTKEALGKMRRVDSFLKETLRHEGIGLVTTERLALRDITLSDGTFLPKGTLTQIATSNIHHDPDVYDNADVFEPFRFADLADDGEGNKHQIVSVNSASLAFGYGKVACPGRFFVAIVLKMMLAHTVLSFDVKVDESGLHPKNLVIGQAIVADPKARIMFRKRSDY